MSILYPVDVMPIELMILLFGVVLVILVCWILLSPSDSGDRPSASDDVLAAVLVATAATSGQSDSLGTDCATVDAGSVDVSSDAGGGGDS